MLTRAAAVDLADVAALLRQADAGNDDDKLRLFLMYAFSHAAPPAADVAALQAVLADRKIDMRPYELLRQVQRSRAAMRTLGALGGAAAGGAAAAASGPAVARPQWVEKGVASVTSLFASSLKQITLFLPSKKDFFLTRVVDCLSDLQDAQIPGLERWPYFDPLTTQAVRRADPFTDVIVYVVGGGNYGECQNLVAFARAPSTKPAGERLRSVVYGCSEHVSPSEFLSALKQ